jgi:hypothetical protein
MKRTAAALVVGLALVAITAAEAATAHGFRDTNAPQEAARILNTLPNVDGMRCHWKLRGHTIGCVGLVKGTTAEMYLWSNGHRVMYRICAAGQCSTTYTARHVFGRPY